MKSRKMKRTSMRLTEQEYADFHKYCEVSGRTLSGLFKAGAKKLMREEHD